MTIPSSPLPDHTAQLRSLMATVGLHSFQALSRQAGVSAWQVRQLRVGQAHQLRAEHLYRLSQVLQISLEHLLAQFSPLVLPIPSPPVLPSPDVEPLSPWPLPAPVPPAAESSDTDPLRDEYRRLEAQLIEQRELLWREFQQTSLQALESWLIQFPTAAHAAQNNPQVPASRLLPLMRPVEQLVQTWNVETIAPVGAEVPYDPHHHQLMEGTAQPGDPVRIRYVGYRQGDRLLHRARVSPV